MTVTVGSLVDKINAKIAAGGLSETELLELAAASRAIAKANPRCFGVATSNCLPSAADNAGRLIYLEDCGSFRFSNGLSWTNNFTSTYSNTRLIWTWGLSGYHLGNSSTVSKSSPTTIIGGITSWCKIPTHMGYATGAIKTDGTLWTWGSSGYGALGDGTTTTNKSSPATVAGGGTTWCTIAGSLGGYAYGWGNTLAAIKTDGTLWTWGCNKYGTLGDGTTVNKSSPVTVAGGGCWTKVSTSEIGGAAIKSDGTMWSWGRGDQGQLGCGGNGCVSSPVSVSGLFTDWCAVAKNFYTSAGVRTNGTLWAWGSGFNGGLGTGNTINRASPVTPCGGGTTWCAVNVGTQNGAAIKTDGTLWVWGRNDYGQIGNGNNITQYSPVSISGGGTTWCFAVQGNKIGAAIKTDGTLWTWGRNFAGALGGGSVADYSRRSPATIAGGGTTWSQVAIGNSFAMATTNVTCGFNGV